jgi:hypothetical protein
MNNNILDLVYRAVIFWTELLTQEQLKHGYVAPNRYYNYTVVITNWFIATKYSTGH